MTALLWIFIYIPAICVTIWLVGWIIYLIAGALRTTLAEDYAEHPRATWWFSGALALFVLLAIISEF